MEKTIADLVGVVGTELGAGCRQEMTLGTKVRVSEQALRSW